MSQQPHVGHIPEFVIPDRLRKAREYTGLDQEAFGLELGISRGSVSNYESASYTGKRKPIVLRAWALRSGVPLEWIETGVAPTEDGPRPGLDQDEDRFSRPRRESNPQQTDYTGLHLRLVA